MRHYLGIDIGGTKCAVLLGDETGATIERIPFATQTDRGPDYALSAINDGIDEIMTRARASGVEIASAGISCGGPLDAVAGIVLSPPNLPGWDQVPIVEIVRRRTGLPATLLNDADASALAEYRFGAGRGSRSMAFLTFGTGLGAGLVLDGRLYSGVVGLAGEIGHMRIAEDGPKHYGKAGSLEGYCSGSGLASLACRLASEHTARGASVPWYTPSEGTERCFRGEPMTAAVLARLADEGDDVAVQAFETSGMYLGRGCAVLIDLLNLDRIVIGSVYVRCRHLLEAPALREIEKEALPPSARMCSLVPAELGERIGDVAALCAAMECESGNQGAEQ